MYLFFATTIGDHGRVAEYYVMEEEWLKALEVINRQV